MRKETPSKEPQIDWRDQFRGRWWWLILLILIPIPFGPWWLTVICLALCAVAAGMLFRSSKKQTDPPTKRKGS